MSAVVLPDAEGAVRTWLRGVDLGVGVRVFFGIPEGDPFPCVIVSRVGGAPMTEIDHDDAEFQFDCWAAGSAKWQASEIARRLVAHLRGLRAGDRLSDEAVALGAEVTLGPFWRPDDVRGLARYIVGARIQLRNRSV